MSQAPEEDSDEGDTRSFRSVVRDLHNVYFQSSIQPNSLALALALVASAASTQTC